MIILLDETWIAYAEPGQLRCRKIIFKTGSLILLLTTKVRHPMVFYTIDHFDKTDKISYWRRLIDECGRPIFSDEVSFVKWLEDLACIAVQMLDG